MKSMVELLLDLGATNVHAALKLSRELKLDEITGVLLKNIALDRNGDSVNLSGLELGAVRPQWILPCLGVSETLRLDSSRRLSSDRIRDLLSRRKSIGCIEDKNLEQLRTEMESLMIRESDGPPTTSDATSSRGDGSERDEPDCEAPLASSQARHSGYRRVQSGGASQVPSEVSSAGKMSSSPVPHTQRGEVPRFERPKSLPPCQQALSLSPEETEQEPVLVLSSTPVKLGTPAGTSSSGFQPTLPTICGTPVGTLRRSSTQPNPRQREISGSSMETVDPPTSPLAALPPPSWLAEAKRERKGVDDSRATLVITNDSVSSDAVQPRTPQRRHHEKLTSLMMQRGTRQNRQLFSPASPEMAAAGTTTARGVAGEGNGSFEEMQSPLSIPKKIASVSPSLLLRRVTMWGKKKSQRLRKLSSNSLSRPGSPPATIFTDITAQSLSGGESRESTPVASNVDRVPKYHGTTTTTSSDEGISTGATLASGGRSGFTTGEATGAGNNTGGFPLSPSSSSNTDSIDGGLFSPTNSTALTGKLHSRRKSSSSINRFFPQLESDQRDGIVDTAGFVVSKAYETKLLRRSSAVREKVTSARLIKILDLSSNSLGGLEEMVGGGEEREDAELGEMVLRRLKGLVRLDLKQNRLRHLPSELMREMKKLSNLNLSCNAFDEMPAECILTPTLTSVDLSTNKISCVPNLPTLPNLTKIALSDNCLTTFPSAINGTSLPHLKILSLRSNKISELVDEDLRLKDLEELYLSRNGIQQIPDRFMASMIALKILDVSHNQLELLPKDRAEDLVELTTLRMACNKMGRRQAEFNHFITSAPVLRTVDATENGLSLIPPPRAWKSCGLKDLRLTGNEITQLDLQDCEKYWPHLETLYIGQNKLKEIPKEIGRLRSLSCLDISHNEDVRHLPDELGLLDHLFLLNLQGLEKLSLDPALLKGPTKNITAFLKSRRVKSVPCYQMKMMMVGGPGRGKTTLLHQLLQEKLSSHSRNNLATLGVNVKHWSYVTDSKTYHINCWDFAGQEEFYSTHQCFLTCRSIYLVVYDISKGESELSCLVPWLLNVQARAPSSPVMLIGTHIDKLNKGEYDFRRLQMRTRVQELCRRPGFPSRLAFSEVDCFNDKMMATLRARVKEQVNSTELRGQKIMGGLVPHNYMLLVEVIQQEKKRLAKTKSRFPVLTSERLKTIMAAGKLKMEKMELDQAVRFLHECGILLHYPDSKSNLSKLFFLEPEWLCSLMAQIVTVTEVNPLINRQGLLQVRSLSHLLKEPKFPSEFMAEYIRLLERFEVVLSQTQQTLLIPSRLSQKKPPSILLPPASAGSQIIRRYLFLYIPPGFWPRLVARLIAFPKRTLPNYIKGNLEGKLEVWAEGIYYFWSEQAFFLVESREGKTSGLDIVVPTTTVGTRLLCSVVDNIEHLIDEWFPGLRDIDTATGRELVCPLALCPYCPISCEPHCFHLSDLQIASTNDDHVVCPTHSGKVILEQLAPDIIISDLDDRFKVLPSDFSIEESSANLLGSGGFGAVYKAIYRGRPVAVKIFSEKTAKINNTTPNYLLRLEVSILSQLEHPHIISLVGVCMRPKPMMLLEYAELGSLRSLHPYNNLSNQLKHRIAMQVASALAYLHKHNIIYRDLKADNVLIFSLSLVTKINAKLSDYGIACTATETGLTQAIGTRGCKAPELLKAPSSYATYNEKVDIYSYGLLIFTVMSNGHKPHEELTDPYEIDKAIEEGRPIKDLEQYGCPPWPDMQDLVTHCLHYLPHQRPSAQEVFDRLCSPEFICLKRAVQMAYDCNMETIAIRTFRDKKDVSKSVEVWMASTLEQQTMLSIMNLSERNKTPKGFMIPTVKVYSMVAVQTSHVILGTESGHLLVYDGYSHKKSHELSPLHDAVLCLQFFKCASLGSYALYAGLASGQLAIYDEYLIPCLDARPTKMLDLGSGPIRSMFQFHDRLYVGCGQEIVLLETRHYAVETRWKAVDQHKSYVTCVEVSQDTVWSSQNRSHSIQLWDVEDGHRHRGEVDCHAMLVSLLPSDSQVDPRGSRVTSMFLQPHPHSVMWVGLGSGHLLLISAPSRNPLMVVHRHIEAIRSLKCHKVPVNEEPVHLILSAGFGFRQRPGELPSLRGSPEMYGNLLIWDAIMPRFKATFEEMRRQQDLYR